MNPTITNSTGNPMSTSTNGTAIATTGITDAGNLGWKTRWRWLTRDEEASLTPR